MKWWNREFKVYSFVLKINSFRTAMFVHELRFDLTYLFAFLFNWKRNSDTSIFPWILPNITSFFIEHLRTAASKTATENSLGNSAQNDKLCIISTVDVWLGFNCASAPGIILKNRTKNVENKTMLKC